MKPIYRRKRLTHYLTLSYTLGGPFGLGVYCNPKLEMVDWGKGDYRWRLEVSLLLGPFVGTIDFPVQPTQVSDI